MKSLDFQSTKIVVFPTTRRGGTDAKASSHNLSLKEFINKIGDYEELGPISARLSYYAARTDLELQKLRVASENQEWDLIQNGAEALVKLSGDVGASDMLRTCYQILMAARQGKHEAIESLLPRLDEDFAKFKSSLQVAT